MKKYLVGGAVRDELLGHHPIKEKDWVVVGETDISMKRAGFKQVGKDFPVFLHPQTHEEYALARKERKTGPGYTGFAFDASPAVTLEEDLLRRDLTINAMAKTEEGEIIDPYGGQTDLKKKILRHVSPAFSEDPVRILRAARFAARFDFKVAPETITLMKEMVKQGEVNALVPERVWKELEKALTEPRPDTFFSVLDQAGVLALLFPGLTGKEKAFLEITPLTQNTLIRFAVLLHPLTEDEITHFCDRYHVPNDYRELAILLARHWLSYQETLKAPPEEVLSFFISTDAFRRFSRFQNLLSACEICSSISSSSWLLSCYEAMQAIDIHDLISNPDKQAIAEGIKQKRLNVIRTVLRKEE